MKEKEETEQRISTGDVSRRSVLTHLLAVITGWGLSSVLNAFRRDVNRIIAQTPLGRRAKVQFGFIKISEYRYRVRVLNVGHEAARNVGAYIAFEEKITNSDVLGLAGSPPNPGVEVEVTEAGAAEITVDTLRREGLDNFNPFYVEFQLEEGTRGPRAFEIERDDSKSYYISYRYSWTFLGEQYYRIKMNYMN